MDTGEKGREREKELGGLFPMVNKVIYRGYLGGGATFLPIVLICLVWFSAIQMLFLITRYCLYKTN